MSRFDLGPFSVNRLGFGAMQLAGPGAFGPPRDRPEALAVLQAAAEAGVDHIDTAQYYGPDVVNDLIREALHPYPSGLAIVTKPVPDATTRGQSCSTTSPTSSERALRTPGQPRDRPVGRGQPAPGLRAPPTPASTTSSQPWSKPATTASSPVSG